MWVFLRKDDRTVYGTTSSVTRPDVNVDLFEVVWMTSEPDRDEVIAENDSRITINVLERLGYLEDAMLAQLLG